MKNKIYSGLIMVFLLVGVFFFNNGAVFATEVFPGGDPKGPNAGGGGQSISVQSPLIQSLLMSIFNVEAEDTAADEAREGARFLWRSATTNALYAALETALKTVAYDAADYIGSGGKGKKPLFIKENWGVYLGNIADNAAGTFLEEMGNNPDFFGRFNLCEPDIRLKVQISEMLLSDHLYSNEPDCTFSEMRDNWSNELQGKNFLNRFQNMFEPGSNDVTIALTLSTDISSKMDEKLREAELFRLTRGGWLSKGMDSLSGESEAPPGEAARRVDAAHGGFMKVIAERDWEDPFIGAAKVFITQLLYASFQNLISNIGSDADNFTSSYKGDLDDLGYEADPGLSGERNNIESKRREFMKPNFTVRGDYEVLAELARCPDVNNAGPTECIITESFREAISKKLTIKEALEQGYLDNSATFGYSSDGIEPMYNEGYPHRSMIILRKFRILPVGWELAAQYIKENIDNGLSDNVFTLNDIIDDYDDESSPFYKLVEPNWVLKAPQNYCAREGVGPQVINQHVFGEGDESELSITRNDNYCADERTCISEGQSGECNYFGYCSKEQRAWESSLKPCDAVYNTCEEYERGGKDRVAYLENSLTVMNDCEKPGCREYHTPTYDDSKENNVNYDSSNPTKYFVENIIDDCDEEDEGCHAYIRTKDRIGANLIVDSSFEGNNDAYTASFPFYNAYISDVEDDEANAYHGSKYFEVDSNANFEFKLTDYEIAGYRYNFSFYSNCDSANWKINGDPNKDSIYEDERLNVNIENNNWELNSRSIIFPEDYEDVKKIKFTITNTGSSCIIDALKMERGDVFDQYNDYMEDGMVYEKLMPDYLDVLEACGSANPPEICDDFVDTCTVDEVWCDLYTARGGYDIPAQIIAQDECPVECVNFDTYIQSESSFDSKRSENFIPETAKTCSVNSLGCEEFTNLDKTGMDAENKEYYSYLRRCIKPNEAILASTFSCEAYNLWSDKEGSELIAVSLKTDNSGNIVLWNSNGACNEAVYNTSISNPNYNHDCRKFQDKNGTISYKLYSKTISCEENCHPFKMTRENFNSSGVRECINNGVWNNKLSACVYNGIAEESIECKAEQNGCREYSGSHGANEHIVMTEDFEGDSDSYIEWKEGSIATGVMDSKSFLSNSSNKIKMSAIMAEKMFEEGYAYHLQFLAYNDDINNDIDVSIYYINGDGDTVDFGTVIVSKESKEVVEINLENFNIKSSSGYLVFESSDTFYIDDVRLTKITDRYYLIRDSWETPDSCHEDIYGKYYANYMLGCDVYKNTDNEVYYLHNFNSLCSLDSVGCEELIDVNNTLSKADDDSYKWIIYDRDKQCSVMGCGRFALTHAYLDHRIYRDMYLQNTNEDDIICSPDDVYCESWTDDNGVSIKIENPDIKSVYEYKDNQIMRQPVKVCYSSETDASDGIKLTSNDCDGDGGLGCYCLGDKDCADSTDSDVSISCEKIDEQTYYEVLDSVDVSVPVDMNDVNSRIKTFGTGGFKVPQVVDMSDPILDPDPDSNGAMVCPMSQSGCTEYISPKTNFNPNLVSNDKVRLQPFTSYIGFDENTSTIKPFSSSVPFTKDIGNSNIIYHYGTNTQSDVAVETDASKLTKASINYWIDNDVDVDFCSGEDLENGCVEFFYDYSLDDNPLSISEIIKVRPDRKCAEWLTCTTYIKDKNDENICLDIGKCNMLTADGMCGNIIQDAEGDQINQERYNSTVLPEIDISNISGYVSVGYSPDLYYYPYKKPNRVNSIPNNLLQFQNMSQSGAIVKVPNGSFEFYNSDGIPLGWEKAHIDSPNIKDVTVFSVINNPVAAQKEGVVYLNNTGKSFLKVSAGGGGLQSQFINVEPNTEYVLSADFNDKNLESAGFASTVRYRVGIGAYNKDNEQLWFGHIGDPYATCEDCDYPNGAWVNVNGFAVSPINSSGKWAHASGRFKTGEETYKIKLHLNGRVWYGAYTLWSGACVGGTGPCLECSSSNPDCIPQYPSMSCGNKEGLKVLTKHKFDADEGRFMTDMDCMGPNPNPDLECMTVPKNICGGDVYIDNIKLESVLEIKEDNSGKFHENFSVLTDNTTAKQTCRLYPKQDSMSCKYYEDSGMYTEGQYGYCLEYDRYPGNNDSCLLWWPVDLVNGQGINSEEMMISKFPVYYCAKADMDFTILEKRGEDRIHIYHKSTSGWNPLRMIVSGLIGGFIGGLPMAILSMSGNLAYDIITYNGVDYPRADPNTLGGFDESLMLAGGIGGTSINEYSDAIEFDTGEWGQCHGAGCGECPFGYIYEVEKDSGFLHSRVNIYCTQIEEDRMDVFPAGYYEYNGDLQKIDSDKSGKGWDEGDHDLLVYFHNTEAVMTYEEARSRNIIMKCDEIYQTVGVTSDNKAWWGRIQDGSDFVMARTLAHIGSTASFLPEIVMDTYSGMYGSMNNGGQGFLSPPDWDGIPDTAAINPVVLGYGTAGGTTFGCAGNNCAVMGICSGGRNNCLAYATGHGLLNGKIKPVIGNSTENNALYPRMPYDLGAEYGCPKGEVCFPIETITGDQMKKAFKRIFAQSYGHWRWSDTTGKYSIVYNNEEDLDNNWNPPTTICPDSNKVRPIYELPTEDPTFDKGLIVMQGSEEFQDDTYMWDEHGIKDCSDIDEIFELIIKNTDTSRIYSMPLSQYIDVSNDCKATAMDMDNDGTFDEWEIAVMVLNGADDEKEVKNFYIKDTFATLGGPDLLIANQVVIVRAAKDGFASGHTLAYIDPDPYGDYCSIPPEISNVKFNNFSASGNPDADHADLELNLNESLHLEFDSVLDMHQLPLTMYAISWGDGATTTMSGIRIQDGLHSLYHAYSKTETMKIKIKIKDNWGWYAGGNYDGSSTSFSDGTMECIDAWVFVGSVNVQ